jgi:hypothetical protein
MQMLVTFIATVQPVLVGFANPARIGHALIPRWLESWWGRQSRDQHPDATKLPFKIQEISPNILKPKEWGFTAVSDKGE